MATAAMRQNGSAGQHARGRLTARERLDILFDVASFVESEPAGHGVVVGHGVIQGRPAAAFSQDVTDAGGAISHRHAEKIGRLIEHAAAAGIPIIGLYDSPGSVLDEGLLGVGAQAAILHQMAYASGRSLQLALVFGETAGTAALAPALADITFMLDQASSLHLAGAELVRQATGEIASTDALGGPALHATQTGIADGVFANEIDLLFAARAFLELLPSSRHTPAPENPASGAAALNKLIPLDPAEPYDMRALIRAIVDDDWFALQPDHAASIICGVARIDGRTIGIIGSQPLVLGGVIDSAAARKATRFVKFCTRFALPIVTLLDSPGFLPGVEEAGRGLVQDAADLSAALSLATMPRIIVVTRRALGPVWAVLGPNRTSGSRCFAWPGAEIAAMHGAAAAELLFGHGEVQKKRDYAAAIADPSSAVDAGFVHAVIPPAATRQTIAAALRDAAPAQGFGSLLPHPSPTGAGQ